MDMNPIILIVFAVFQLIILLGAARIFGVWKVVKEIERKTSDTNDEIYNLKDIVKALSKEKVKE